MIARIVFSLKNYREALLAALFFGCIAPGIKLLIKDIPPQSLAGLLYFSAGLGLFIVLVLKNEFRQSISMFQPSDRKWLAAATLFGGILGPAFLTYAMIRMTGATASLLLNLESVLTSIIAWTVFKEHFEKKIVWGMLLIVAGCLILSIKPLHPSGVDTLIGALFIALACLSWGIDNNVTRNISHLNPIFTASIKGLIAGSVNLFLGYMIGEKLVMSGELLQAGILGFLGIGVSLVAFILSLSKIGTARTGALFSTAPFIGSILSILIIGEKPTLSFSIALFLMACGVWLHLSENHVHEHTHSILEHNHEHIHDDHHQHSHELDDPIGAYHSHWHRHEPMIHSHPHFPDIHHQHRHESNH